MRSKKLWIFTFGALILLVVGSLAQNAIRAKRDSVVIFDDVPVYREPDPTSALVTLLQKGRDVSVSARTLKGTDSRQTECWIRIGFGFTDSQSGFVRCEEVQQPLGAPRASDSSTKRAADSITQLLALLNVDLVQQEMSDRASTLLSNTHRADENSEQIRHAFEDAQSAVSFMDAARAEIAPFASSERVRVLIDKLKQPLFEKIRVLSARAGSAGAARDLIPYLTQMVTIPASPKRTQLLDRIDRAHDEPEASINTIMVMARVLIKSRMDNSQIQNKPSPEQIETYLKDVQARFRSSIVRRNRIVALYTFAPLTDEELEGYATFEESADAVWLRDLIRGGLLKATSEYATKLVNGLAQLATSPVRPLKSPSDSHDAHELYRQAVWLIDNDRPTEAIPFLDAVIQLEPGNALAYYKRGNAYRDSDKDSDAPFAARDYKAAIQYDPTMALAYLNLGNTLRFLGQKNEAMDVYNHGLVADARLSGLWIQRAINFEDLGKLKEAIADYTQAVRLVPSDGEALAWRGMAHGVLAESMRSQGTESYPEWQRSWEDCEAGIRVGVRESEQGPVYACIGRALELMNKYQEAVKALDRSIELEPNKTVGYLHRGYSLEQLGKLEAALKDYDASIKIEPDDEWAHCRRSIVLKALGRVDDAAKDAQFCSKN